MLQRPCCMFSRMRPLAVLGAISCCADTARACIGSTTSQQHCSMHVRVCACQTMCHQPSPHACTLHAYALFICRTLYTVWPIHTMGSGSRLGVLTTQLSSGQARCGTQAHACAHLHTHRHTPTHVRAHTHTHTCKRTPIRMVLHV